ncbi:hypothetical protein HYT01_03580 [Candidatus Giovannonibacteria bacterium]|nr:hypothetical protein [Candidatus Giovannonibacteria bacterium]
MALTKQDLDAIEGVLDKKLMAYQGAIIEAVDFKFQKLEKRMDSFDTKLDKLTSVLEDFLKQMSDMKEEFTILKAEVDKIKSFIKEKFGVEIAVQG